MSSSSKAQANVAEWATQHVPYRDAAKAALAEETRRKAAYWTSLEGGVHNTKRVRLNDFQRGAGIVTVRDHADFGAHTRA